MVGARPEVFNHNIETVGRLQRRMRGAKASYDGALLLLRGAKEIADYPILTKSGIIAGLGETNDEVVETMRDLRANGVDVVTIGQYCSHPPGKRRSTAGCTRTSSAGCASRVRRSASARCLPPHSSARATGPTSSATRQSPVAARSPTSSRMQGPPTAGYELDTTGHYAGAMRTVTLFAACAAVLAAGITPQAQTSPEASHRRDNAARARRRRVPGCGTGDCDGDDDARPADHPVARYDDGNLSGTVPDQHAAVHPTVRDQGSGLGRQRRDGDDARAAMHPTADRLRRRPKRNDRAGDPARSCPKRG